MVGLILLPVLVREVACNDLREVALAVPEVGGPVIYWSRRALAAFGVAVVNFARFHECAHIMLDHFTRERLMPAGVSRVPFEDEADAWAAQQLVMQGHARVVRAAVEHFRRGFGVGPGDGDHRSGPGRARVIARAAGWR